MSIEALPDIDRWVERADALNAPSIIHIYSEENEPLLQPVGTPSESDTNENNRISDLDLVASDIAESDISDMLDEPTDVVTSHITSYLNQIGKYPLINAEQEVDLAIRIEAGQLASEKLSTQLDIDESLKRDYEAVAADGNLAKQKFFEANLRLVVSIAMRYRGKGLPIMDLIQEGNLGLLHAIELFDYTKGYKFATYATIWIKENLRKAMADQSRTIRLPVDVATDLNNINKAYAYLYETMQRSPTPLEISNHMGMSSKRIIALMNQKTPTSIDKIIKDDDFSIMNLLEDKKALAVDERLFAEELSGRLDQIIERSLSPQQATVVRLKHFYNDKKPPTFLQIGNHLDISGVYAGIIYKNALKILKQAILSDAVASSYLNY